MQAGPKGEGVVSHVARVGKQDQERTGGKNHLLQLGKQMMATPKLMTPSRAYPKIQHVKYDTQNSPVRRRSRGDQSISRPISRIPNTDEGPIAAIARSRLILSVSEWEGKLGKAEGRRSGSVVGMCVAGCKTCVTCYRPDVSHSVFG